MKLHFIAIGGAAMHNLAIALHKKGYQISGSDDEIFEPSRGRLKKYGLLPDKIGWDKNNISHHLDAVILGMHAREDNPELLKAQKLGLKVYSLPEFLYDQSKNKIRVVIGGSHGKTTITAMILHVLKQCNIDCDYMVGAQLDGFEVMVKLSDGAKIIILEGDEYLTSPIDRRPKFHVYQPTIGLVSGIAWDHMNVFPTFDNYVEQFSIFADMIDPKGALVYCREDKVVNSVAEVVKEGIKKIPYGTPEYSINNNQSVIKFNGIEIPLKVFGEHNMQNIAGAMKVCKELGIKEEKFLNAIQSFEGASRRLEKVAEKGNSLVYKDFAHSPSKLRATVNAMKSQYPERILIACMELHTFSSLNADFLEQYEGSMDAADRPIVFFKPETLKHKKLPPITTEQVKQAFNNTKIEVINDTEILKQKLMNIDWTDKNLLLMSSGNFGGIDVDEFASELLK